MGGASRQCCHSRMPGRPREGILTRPVTAIRSGLAAHKCRVAHSRRSHASGRLARGGRTRMRHNRWSHSHYQQSPRLWSSQLNRRNNPRRFGLTGTTIQNSYMEMWTILDWTNPGRLGSSKQWTGYVVRPLTIGQSAAATEDQRTTALVRSSYPTKCPIAS